MEVVETMEPLSAVTGAISITQGLLQFLGYIRGIAGSGIISAYFRSDGKRIQGSDKLEIETHPDQKAQDIWWYSVKEIDDYVFVRIPVIQSCVHELVGKVSGEALPDSRYWRWVAQERQGVIVDGSHAPSNVKVDFLVVGYRPKDLIKHFSPI